VTLLSYVTAVALVTAVLFWALLKVLKWAISQDNDGILAVMEQFQNTYRLFLVVALLLVFGDGVGEWLYDAWSVLRGVTL